MWARFDVKEHLYEINAYINIMQALARQRVLWLCGEILSASVSEVRLTLDPVLKDIMSSANKFHLRLSLITEQIVSPYECLMALSGPADFPHTRNTRVPLHENSITEFPEAAGQSCRCVP